MLVVSIVYLYYAFMYVFRSIIQIPFCGENKIAMYLFTFFFFLTFKLSCKLQKQSMAMFVLKNIDFLQNAVVQLQ